MLRTSTAGSFCKLYHAHFCVPQSKNIFDKAFWRAPRLPRPGATVFLCPPFNYSTGLKRQSYAKIRDDRMRLNATQHFCAVGATWRIRPNGPIILAFFCCCCCCFIYTVGLHVSNFHRFNFAVVLCAPLTTGEGPQTPD